MKKWDFLTLFLGVVLVVFIAISPMLVEEVGPYSTAFAGVGFLLSLVASALLGWLDNEK